MNTSHIVGRVEHVDLMQLGVTTNVPAKVDTGADASSIWISKAEPVADGLRVIFFGPSSPYYTGEEVLFKDYRITRVANSFGQKELRYKIKLSIRLKGKRVRATFTLADRSQKLYPILIGRRLLRGRFVVDVSHGHGLHELERARVQRLVEDMKVHNAGRGKL